jgi:hypothetical protein
MGTFISYGIWTLETFLSNIHLRIKYVLTLLYDLDFRSENHIDAKLVAQVLVPVYDAQWPIKLTWETSLLLPDILGFWIK